MIVDCLDNMAGKVHKETFGSQCLKATMAELKSKAAETQHPKLCSYVSFQLGRICYIMRDFRQAKMEFKIASDISELFFDKIFLMKCSEWLGKTCSMLKSYMEAIQFFSVMLHLAWSENKKKYENRAYDQIGMQHFYLDNVSKAKKYHHKMVEGEFENADSEMRLLTKDLYQKKEAEKRLYYSSRDKLLRYHMVAQIMSIGGYRFDEPGTEGSSQLNDSKKQKGLKQNKKMHMDENELPGIDAVITQNKKNEFSQKEEKRHFSIYSKFGIGAVRVMSKQTKPSNYSGMFY